MKLGLGVLLLVAASCARDSGVIIEVTATSAEVDKIRLFIGTGDPAANVALIVPGAMTAGTSARRTVAPLTRWGRDPQNEDDYALVGANETARFVLVKTDVDSIGAIIAVGYRGTQPIEIATLFGVALPGNEYRLYHLTLEAPVAPPLTWGPDLAVAPTEAVCIGYSDPQQSRPELATAFIVTPGDQDCDGLYGPDDGECNPDAWKGARPPNLDEVTCLAVEPEDSTCHLGGPLCKDGLAPEPGECSPSDYCAPAALCTRMVTLDEAKDVTPLLFPDLAAGYACTIHVDNGALCQDELRLPQYPTGGRSCTHAAIATAGQPFDNHFDFTNPAGKIGISLRDSCEVSLLPSGKVPLKDTLGSMVAVDLDNGHGVAIPVVFEIDRGGGGCGADLVCRRSATLADKQLADCATAIRPTLVEELVKPSGVDDPTLTGDMLDIWFNVDDKEIWHSSRPSLLMPWSPPGPVLTLNAPQAHTKDPHVSPDGLTMHVGSDRAGGMGGYDLWVSRRASRTASWSVPELVTELASSGDETGGAIDGTGGVLVFEQSIQLGALSDLFIANRPSSTAMWTNPTVMGASTQASDSNPHLTKDGLGLWFTTSLPGFGQEVFSATRVNTESAFGNAQRVLELSSTANDSDPWVSPDGHTVFFASNRIGGIDQIFVTHR